MTEQDKKLLLKDICARIPYGVKCTTKSTAWTGVYTVVGYKDNRVYLDNPQYHDGDDEWLVEQVVPYLRPMSSMTEKEVKRYRNLCDIDDNDWEVYYQNCESIDYLNSIHVDYRNLIQMGLALEAPEEMYD